MKIVKLNLWEKELSSFPYFKKKLAFEIKALDPTSCEQIASQAYWAANFNISVDLILKDSDICYIATKDSRLIHWTQVTFKSAYVIELNKNTRPDPNTAYLYGVFTALDFRKTGVATAVIQEISSRLTGQGIGKIYILSDKDPMQKILIKTGFKKIGSAYSIKIGKIEIYRYFGKSNGLLK
jgi:hypothetical protein